MQMQYTFKYGDLLININLAEETVIREHLPKETVPIVNIRQELFQLLDNPISSKPFDEIFRSGDKVVILVSDITRLWIQTSKFLPFIIERLNLLGIEDSDIIILIANGTHRGQTEVELKQIVGEDIFRRIEILEHDCDGDLVYVGTTSRGTGVCVNSLVVDRKIILTGGIVHHLMAGYGGGRKSILPGVAGRKTIAQNHLHALDPLESQSNPAIGAAVLTDNPLNIDMIEAASFVNPHFLINSITDAQGNILKLAVGHWLTAWERGCQWVDEIFSVTIEERADLVIASCGGYPKDISLYQSTKALLNAVQGVKPGGTVLLLAECRDGAGGDNFFSWSTPLEQGKLDEELRKNFTIPGYIFYAAVEAAQNCKVILLSQINPEIIKPMGIQAVCTLEEALELAGTNRKNQKVLLLPYGGSTLPVI